MKKRSSLLLMICLIFSLAACGSNTNDALAGSEQQTAGDQQERSGEELGSFNKSASLDETVMVDENGVKITATGLNYTDYSVDLELSIENSSGKDLSFSSGTMGYHCNSINGYMVSDGYLNCDVQTGKKQMKPSASAMTRSCCMASTRLPIWRSDLRCRTMTTTIHTPVPGN